jgi:hypothetical protein
VFFDRLNRGSLAFGIFHHDDAGDLEGLAISAMTRLSPRE